MRKCLVFSLGALLSACAPVLSTLQPAAVTPQGDFRVAGGMGVSVPVGPLLEVIESGNSLSSRVKDNESLSEDEVKELWDAGVGLTLSPPSVASEAQVRYGFMPGWDAGLRMSPGAFRLDGRYQFMRSDQGSFLDGSVGAGISFYSLKLQPSEKAEKVIAIDDFKRTEVDVPLLFGWSGKLGHFWVGPKLMFMRYTTGMTLNLANDEQRAADVTGSGVIYALQVGGAVGYGFIWLAAEITVAGMSNHATITTPAEELSADFGGLILYPAVALLVEI